MSPDRPPVRVVCVTYHPQLSELTDFATSLRRATSAPVELVIVDNGTDQAVAEQVARETGARYGGVLYVDSLSEEGGAVPTYLELLSVTANTIAEGLAG